MTPDERRAQLAIARTHIKHLDHGGRPRGPAKPIGPKGLSRRWYRKLTEMCKAGAEVKLVYRTLEEAKRQQKRFLTSHGCKDLAISKHGNTVKVSVR